MAAKYSFKWSHWDLTDFSRSLKKVKEQDTQKFRGKSVSGNGNSECKVL